MWGVLNNATRSPGSFCLFILHPQCVGFVSSDLSPRRCEMAATVAGITSSDSYLRKGGKKPSISFSLLPPSFSPSTHTFFSLNLFLPPPPSLLPCQAQYF